MILRKAPSGGTSVAIPVRPFGSVAVEPVWNACRAAGVGRMQEGTRADTSLPS